MAKAKRGSPTKAKGRAPKVAGTPKQKGGQQIASLQASGKAARPPSRGGGKAAASGGYRGSPLVVSNPVNSGERSVATSQADHPKVYKGGSMMAKPKSMPRTKGTSASGQQGAK
jgi:hypothetical protein